MEGIVLGLKLGAPELLIDGRFDGGTLSGGENFGAASTSNMNLAAIKNANVNINPDIKATKTPCTQCGVSIIILLKKPFRLPPFC